MTYGMLNTAYADAWVAAAGSNAPTVEALAIALAMPAVEVSGTPAKRGGLKAPGITTWYLSLAFSWAFDFTKGVDPAVYAVCGSTDVKQNNIRGLGEGHNGQGQQMLVRHKSPLGQYQVALTDKGLAQVKLVSPELYKAVKGVFDEAAYDKAQKAFMKANKVEAAADKPKAKRVRKAKPVEAEAPSGEVDTAIAAVKAGIDGNVTFTPVEGGHVIDNPQN